MGFINTFHPEYRAHVPLDGILQNIINKLSRDHSREVRSFVSDIPGALHSSSNDSRGSKAKAEGPAPHSKEHGIFSRPPPSRQQHLVTPFKVEVDLKTSVRPKSPPLDRPGFHITISSSNLSVTKNSQDRTSTITVRDNPSVHIDRNRSTDFEVGSGNGVTTPNSIPALQA
jgi:hypothetical protein